MITRFNLEPFASPGYRRYFLATALVALALWIYQPALEWIVLIETGRAAAVGLLQTALIVSIALATLPSGLLTARYGPRRTLTASILGLAGMVGLIALVAALDRLTFEVALVLSFATGLFDGLFSVPAALLVAQVVAPRFIGAAIGLSYLTSGLGRLVGGPLGGTVLQLAGPVPAFLPAALILVVAASVIFTLPGPATPTTRASGGGRGDLRAAARWLRGNRPILAVTALGTLSGVSIFAYSALLPAFTRDELLAGPATLGLLSGAGGVGSIVGALAMEPVGRRLGRGRQVVATFVGSGLAVGALGLTNVLPVALALTASITLLSIGFGGTAQLLVQTAPPMPLRAGVVAIYTFAYYCVLPVGTATVGSLADAFGVTAVLLGMAGLTVLGAGVILAIDRSLLRVDLDRYGDVMVRGAPVPEATP